MNAMAGKLSRKGKNPGPIDSWLDALGFYRKNVAYDETCLFRAVSEQLYCCQIFHERVRKECITYAKENYREFQHLFPTQAEWESHLEKLSTHMAICGPVEIEIVSRKYRRNIIVFNSTCRKMEEIIHEDYMDSLLLCLMSEDHYDVVYAKEYISTAGFCQSVAYSILYENVFEIPQVPEIVQTMLYDKPPFLTSHSNYFPEENCSSQERNKRLEDSDGDPGLDIKKKVDVPIKPDNMTDFEFMLKTNLAPFPFKVAKALDPTIYRNIEYDTWTEIRKEMRLGEWYYGDNNLILGTRCILVDKGEKFECYIQEILKESNQCVVFITHKAEKRTVNYSDLSPENDAKPWPLPYRFSKNLVLCPPLESGDKERKVVKKRKDKKRSTSKSSNDSEKCAPSTGLTLDITNKINAYEGCPLQMQQVESYDENTQTPMDSSNSCYTPSDQSSQWSNQWEQGVPQTPTSYVWTHAPVTPQNVYTYPTKPVVTPAADGSYGEPCYYYDNYRYGMWNNGEYATAVPADQGVPQSPSAEIPMSPDPSYNYVYYPDTGFTTSSPKICLPMTPTSPQVELYHPPVFPQPGTPVIYTPEISEMVMQPPPVTLFTPPPIEYMTTPICMIPTTPTNSWYPPGINSQGFIFPPPVNPHQNIPTRI